MHHLILDSHFSSLLAAILDYRSTDEVFQDADSLNSGKPMMDPPTLKHGAMMKDIRSVSVLINLPFILSTFDKYTQLSQITTLQAN